MREFHFYEPKMGHGLKHDPLNSIVAPRPIGWISSQSADGVLNLAPYSFFNAFNYTPPIIGFSSIGWKDSVRNIAASKEFVWNLASRPLAEQMNTSSALVAPEVNEFELAGLATAPSRLVKPPRVLASPVSFECRLSDIVQLQNANGGLIDTWLVLGEVVAVHIDTAVLEDGVYNTVLAQPIMRGGGPTDYFSIEESQRFHMHRPIVP
jgi:flavin reductase (DIM6/NTAB) family NADH-FMN oxidoreductase RutF